MEDNLFREITVRAMREFASGLSHKEVGLIFGVRPKEAKEIVARGCLAFGIHPTYVRLSADWDLRFLIQALELQPDTPFPKKGKAEDPMADPMF